MKLILILLLVASLASPAVKSACAEDLVEEVSEKKVEVTQERTPPKEILKKSKTTKAENKSKEEDEQNLRLKVLEEEAKECGYQNGFSNRYKELQKKCEAKTKDFDETFPFDQVLLSDGKVRPPVITYANEYTERPDEQHLIRTGTAYRILRSAEFVTTPPSWRTYLILDEDTLTPRERDKRLKIKTAKEKKVWDETYKKFYDEGIIGAEDYFLEEINTLKRDFLGMIQYHILNRQGKISLPTISQGHLDLKISDDTMEIDQRTFIISDAPHFQDKKQWRHFGKNYKN